MQHQDHREIIFFEQFVELWTDYPSNADFEKTETPDFIIHPKNSKKIGVEITELINSKRPHEKFQITKKFSLENKIVKTSFDLYTKSCAIPIGVRMSFLKNFECRNHEITKMGKELSDIIVKEVEKFDLSRMSKFEKRDGLPKQITCISGIFFPEISETLWYATQGGFLPNIDNRELIKLILKKEILIPKYKLKVDQIYLLIIEGNPPISWFYKFVDWRSNNLYTSFDKIFLLRRQEHKLYELI